MYGSVRRKGSRLTDSKPAMLPLQARENRSKEALDVLAIEGFQEERREYETVSLDDDDANDQSEDVVYVESKSDGNTTSKKRKASKKLKSPRFVSSHFLTVVPCKPMDLLNCMSFAVYGAFLLLGVSESSFIEVIFVRMRNLFFAELLVLIFKCI